MTARKTLKVKAVNAMPFSYAEVEGQALAAVAKHKGVAKLNGVDSAHSKEIHAELLKSIAKRGPGKSAEVYLADVKAGMKSRRYKANKAKYGTFISQFITILMPFLEMLWPILLQFIEGFLKQYIAQATGAFTAGGQDFLSSLAQEAGSEWP